MIIIIDIQQETDTRGVYINRVGIKNYLCPIVFYNKKGKCQNTVATINLYVSLETEARGIHMSRLIEMINKWRDMVSLDLIGTRLDEVKRTLSAKESYIEIKFPFFIEKIAPESKLLGLVDYECEIIGRTIENNICETVLKVNIPITSVCPCSKAISQSGAHNQRGLVSIVVKYENGIEIENIIQVAEKAASCEIFSVLKRKDEKHITEKGFENAKFVEDIIRDIKLNLDDMRNVNWVSISVENFESIHNHNAYAFITKP